MTDRELLELAAKAAGIGEYIGMCADAYQVPAAWNPLTDDGDALRLAVKLKLEVVYWGDNSVAVYRSQSAAAPLCAEYHNDDPYAATRRAIVRAAAEIGKGMEQ